MVMRGLVAGGSPSPPTWITLQVLGLPPTASASASAVGGGSSRGAMRRGLAVGTSLAKRPPAHRVPPLLCGGGGGGGGGVGASATIGNITVRRWFLRRWPQEVALRCSVSRPVLLARGFASSSARQRPRGPWGSLSEEELSHSVNRYVRLHRAHAPAGHALVLRHWSEGVRPAWFHRTTGMRNDDVAVVEQPQEWLDKFLDNAHANRRTPNRHHARWHLMR